MVVACAAGQASIPHQRVVSAAAYDTEGGLRWNDCRIDDQRVAWAEGGTVDDRRCLRCRPRDGQSGELGPDGEIVAVSAGENDLADAFAVKDETCGIVAVEIEPVGV